MWDCPCPGTQRGEHWLLGTKGPSFPLDWRVPCALGVWAAGMGSSWPGVAPKMEGVPQPFPCSSAWGAVGSHKGKEGTHRGQRVWGCPQLAVVVYLYLYLYYVF